MLACAVFAACGHSWPTALLEGEHWLWFPRGPSPSHGAVCQTLMASLISTLQCVVVFQQLFLHQGGFFFM